MHQPLTPAVFHILLALSLKERHGYEIMKQVEEDSGGRVTLGPGTLYTAIRRLLDDGWIAVASSDTEGDERRKYYKLTSKGKAVLAEETQRLHDVAGLAQRRLGFFFQAFA
jgi:DNA-binding PadR family transcriptional regulator